MRLRPTQAHLLFLGFLAGCAGHRPLGTIEPVPGSRSRTGGEIVPLDSTRSHEIRPLDIHGREIVPLDSAHRAHPAPDATAPGREIHPLGTTPGAEHEIRPLNGAAAPATGREIQPMESTVVPVDGSSWHGMNVEGEVTFEFLVGGILRYTNAAGTWTNGTWHQDSNTITFEMNSHYADYTGRIRGTRMSGTAHNTTGRTWDWYATRQ